MACGACAKKAAAKRMGNGEQPIPLPAAVTPTPPVAPRPVDTVSQFVTKRYIGPKQKVPSVSDLLSYGTRSPGEILLILASDVEAHPEWWENV